MEIAKKNLIVSHLIEYWIEQNIPIVTNTDQENESFSENGILKLPKEFKEFYSRVNGMGNFYPNEIDKEGFLFYPIQAIKSANAEFKNAGLLNTRSIFIFAEYMHKSWWYGFELFENEDCIIGIIPDANTFKPITKSLFEFLELYLEDSSKLYEYS
jgi:hypothetical protein